MYCSEPLCGIPPNQTRRECGTHSALSHPPIRKATPGPSAGCVIAPDTGELGNFTDLGEGLCQMPQHFALRIASIAGAAEPLALLAK